MAFPKSPPQGRVHRNLQNIRGVFVLFPGPDVMILNRAQNSFLRNQIHTPRRN